MRRIVVHWTGGGHIPNARDLASYHFLVTGAGRVVDGDKPPEANRSPLRDGYVRHAGGFNSDAIGVALCGMVEAREHPFDEGSQPVTTAAYNAAVRLSANLCETYGIKPARQTVLLHSEVRPRFGRGVYKWDVNWLPGMVRPGDPVEMGDAFRARVRMELEERRKPDLWTLILQHFGRAA